MTDTMRARYLSVSALVCLRQRVRTAIEPRRKQRAQRKQAPEFDDTPRHDAGYTQEQCICPLLIPKTQPAALLTKDPIADLGVAQVPVMSGAPNLPCQPRLLADARALRGQLRVQP